MFSKDQIELLEAPLNRDVVKSRKKGSTNLSYIEGWHSIAEANRIFGFGNWSRETVYCKEVSRTPQQVGYEKKDGWKVGYESMVRIIVTGHDGQVLVTRTGTGHGSGISTDLFDAIEGASKESETDSMKRALMTFGNSFGLALYDKEQRNVVTTGEDEVETKEPPMDVASLIRLIESSKTVKEVLSLQDKHKDLLTSIATSDKVQYSIVTNAIDLRIKTIKSTK